MKVAELTGEPLDRYVALAAGFKQVGAIWDAPVDWRPSGHTDDDGLRFYSYPVSAWKPSTDWAHGGPIIELERIHVCPLSKHEMLGEHAGWWSAKAQGAPLAAVMQYDPSPLVAAMRAYVSIKFGDEVEEVKA